MKKPTVHFNSRGESGNIFYILGLVRREMQKQRRITEYNDLYFRVRTYCYSYTEALTEIRKIVDLIDDDGVY